MDQHTTTGWVMMSSNSSNLKICYVQSIHINSKDVRITLCCFGVQDLDIGFFRNLPPTASPQSEASHAGRWLGACHGMRSELMSVQMGSIIGYDMWIWYEHIWTIVVYGYELKFVFHLLIMLDPLFYIQSHSSKHLPSSSFPSIFAECIHQPPWRTKGLNLAVGIWQGWTWNQHMNETTNQHWLIRYHFFFRGEEASVPTFLFARSDRIEKYGCLVHFTINSKKRPVLLQFFYTPQHTPSFFWKKHG